jgi:hypothetical protein
MLSSERKKIKPFIVLISKDQSLFKPTYWDYRLQYQQLKPNLKYSYYLYIKYDAMRVIPQILCTMGSEGNDKRTQAKLCGHQF